MQQYEFKLVSLHGFRKDADGNHEYEAYLNKMGAEGWRRKGVDLVAGDTMVIMERPKIRECAKSDNTVISGDTSKPFGIPLPPPIAPLVLPEDR